MRITREFTGPHGYKSTAYTDDGKVWRWQSNNAVCPLDSCQDHGIPCDEQVQEEARDKEVSEFLKDYRERQKNHVHSPEELFEMRAAFGPGTTVVNVFTGKKIQL